MMPPLLRSIREDAAWVMSQARDVQIRQDAVAAYARQLVAQNPEVVSALDDEQHFVDPAQPVRTAAYVIALDSINFGSGAFHIAQRDGIDLEYHRVAQGLKQAVEREELASLEDWQRATPGQCHAVFGIPAGVHPVLDTLMVQFAQHLQLSADAVAKDFGDIEAMVRAYQGRGPALFEKIAQWPHFRDVAPYRGRVVSIYKRAQILLADIELALAPRGGHWFGGLEHLTCFADNMVPHVLRADGVLHYSPQLAARIDAGEMIAAGSPEETELRCAAIHTVELLRASLGGTHTSVNLDHMLWHRGYLPGFTTLKPHRTSSTWY